MQLSLHPKSTPPPLPSGPARTKPPHQALALSKTWGYQSLSATLNLSTNPKYTPGYDFDTACILDKTDQVSDNTRLFI